MSNIKIITDGFGRPKPVKEEELFEYGLDITGQPTGGSGGSLDATGVASDYVPTSDGEDGWSWQPTPSGSGESTVRIELTASDIASIDVSPVECLPAPGAGKYIHIHSIIGISKYTGNSFDGGNFYVKTMPPYDVNWMDITTLAVDPISQVKNYVSSSGIIPQNYIVNSPIIVQADASPGTGTTEISLIITYSIIDI